MSDSMGKEKYPLKQYLKDMWSFIKPYKAKFFLAVIFRAIGDIVNLYPAWAFAQIVVILSKSTPKNDINQIILLLLGWFLTKFLRAIFKQWAKYLGYQVAEKIDLDAKRRSLKYIYTLDLAWQEKENSGNKMKRINNGGTGLQNTIRIIYTNLIEIFVNTVGIGIALFTMDKVIGIAQIIFVLSFYTFAAYLSKKIVKQEYNVKEKEEEFEGLAFESVNNIQTVKALNLNERMNKGMKNITEDLFVRIKKRIKLFQFRSFIIGVYVVVFEITILSYLIYMILEGHYEIGILIVFTSYFGKVVDAVWELADVNQELLVYKIWIQRMMNLLGVKPTIEGLEDETAQLEYPENWKEMSFNDVKFSYGDRQNIDGLTFSIKRGEKIGIVGLSGAGKSTLFKLLLDLYEDYKGEISIGGRDLKKIRRGSYIDNLAVVLQDTELFNTSLKQNIKMAGVEGRDYPDSEMEKIYTTANLEDLIEKLPHGEDTIVGEKGVKLSGGERQRLGIARALYRKPDILLLDEATSHLDAESEKKIQASLGQFFDKVTAIVIAHRLSTLKEMDRIIVLDEGKIVEEGTFESLLKKGGYFTKLWKMQRI